MHRYARKISIKIAAFILNIENTTKYNKRLYLLFWKEMNIVIIKALLMPEEILNSFHCLFSGVVVKQPFKKKYTFAKAKWDSFKENNFFSLNLHKILDMTVFRKQ